MLKPVALTSHPTLTSTTGTYPDYPFSVDNPGTIHEHHTRQIFVATAAVGRILGTFLKLFNDHKIKEITHYLLNFSNQYNKLTSIVKKHKHEIATLHAELTSLTNVVESLIMYNPTLVYAILQSNINQMTKSSNILFQALQQLQHQCLAVTLLDSNQLDIIFKAARNAAHSLQKDLILIKPQDLFQLDASYIQQKNEHSLFRCLRHPHPVQVCSIPIPPSWCPLPIPRPTRGYCVPPGPCKLKSLSCHFGHLF